MAEFELSYLHNGSARAAVIYADSYREAYEQFESMKETGVVWGRLEGRIDADLTGEQIERLRE